MSLDSFATSYHSLQTACDALREQLTSADSFEHKKLAQQGQQLLQLWQQNFATVQGDNLSGTAFHQWRSLHTEIHRELRLLNMDLMFLGNSRSAQTQTAKQKTAGDRLEKILQYCKQIQEIICSDDPHIPEA